MKMYGIKSKSKQEMKIYIYEFSLGMCLGESFHCKCADNECGFGFTLWPHKTRKLLTKAMQTNEMVSNDDDNCDGFNYIEKLWC